MKFYLRGVLVLVVVLLRIQVAQGVDLEQPDILELPEIQEWLQEPTVQAPTIVFFRAGVAVNQDALGATASLGRYDYYWVNPILRMGVFTAAEKPTYYGTLDIKAFSQWQPYEYFSLEGEGFAGFRFYAPESLQVEPRIGTGLSVAVPFHDYRAALGYVIVRNFPDDLPPSKSRMAFDWQVSFEAEL